MDMHEKHFFSHWPAFLFWPRIFSRSLSCETRSPPSPVYSRRKFGPRPGSVARLGVQSRASWQVITGSLSAEPEARRTMEQRKKMNSSGFSRIICCVQQLTPRLATSHLADGHLAPRPSPCATAVTFPARFFVPRCSVCDCVLAKLHADLFRRHASF